MSEKFIAEVHCNEVGEGIISHPKLKNLIGSIVRVEITYLGDADY